LASTTTTSSKAPAKAPTLPQGNAAQVTALALPQLGTLGNSMAQALAGWAHSLATGARGVTATGAYAVAALVAQAANGGNAVATAQVGAMHRALGGNPPGWPSGQYAQGKGLTANHSAYYGANLHLGKLGGAVPSVPSTGRKVPQATYYGAVPGSVGAALVAALRTTQGKALANLQATANANLAAYRTTPCGCSKRGKACGANPGKGGHALG
jgi:hypothetical protein